MSYQKLSCTIHRLFTALVLLGWLLPNAVYAGAPIMVDPDNNLQMVQEEAGFGVIGNPQLLAADPGNVINLAGDGLIATKLTYTDYFNAYQRASAKLGIGVHFRSQQLQRLDPATCVTTPEDRDKCRFSVLKMQNNYLDFNGSRLYWRFCADYDEPFVGQGQTPQAEDDPTNRLRIDPFGYCPIWNSLEQGQRDRRVQGGLSEQDGIDIRNGLIDAQRTFAFLALAEPADLTFANVDGLTVLNDGTPQRRLVAGPDGKADRARDAGVFGLLQTTREIANVHLIFGNEFMVDALRFPFSVTGGDSEQLVRDEQQKLQRALHQFNLAVDALLYTLNYNLGGAQDTYTADFFTEQDISTFATASERAVIALTEIAKRDRLLGTDASTGNQAAVNRLEESFLNQYLQGLTLASQATGGAADDPTTPNINESRLRFLDNGGREILNNLRRLVQQTQSIRAGLNPLGYADSFVPLKSFEELMTLTCGSSVACSDGAGLLRSAALANDELRASQGQFDGSYRELTDNLKNLKDKYETALTEICGQSSDANGDGLLDFATCGPRDIDGDGRYDQVSQNSGLMAQNFWEMVAAAKEVDLAQARIDNNLARILSEIQRSTQVISVTLAAGNKISANELAIGKANAYKNRNTVIFSESATAYVDASASASASMKATAKVEANPVGCILGGCGGSWQSELEFKASLQVGMRAELATIGTQELIWDPTEEEIGQFRSASALKEAERDAKIEGANSADAIRALLLEQSELLIQKEIAQQNYNKTIAEHNLLVDQYTLNLTQRQNTIADTTNSHLAKPYFRLFRDGAALEAARTLDQATQAAYLAAKAWEYHTLTPVSYLYLLYRARNPGNLDAFLDKLAADYFALPAEQFSKRTYRLSLAQDIFGLTNQNLDPGRTLSPDAVEQLRTQRFQEILRQNRYTNPSVGVDKIVILFATELANPKFLQGVFNNRIARITSSDPGCASGCRGLWLNLVTDQNVSDFQGDLPQITLTHGGQAAYRNAQLQEIRYNPAPAVMIGRSLPPGFEDNGTRAAVMTTHVNLGVSEQPDTNLLEDRFYNLSIATSQWGVEINLQTPTENTVLDLSKLRDIEIRMDTTYVTPNHLAQVAAASNAQLDAQEAGQPTPPEAEATLAAYAQTVATEQAIAAANVAATAAPSQATANPPAGDLYAGSQFVTDPVNLGTAETGFYLKFNPDGTISGSLCDTCTPLYDQPVPVTGSYDVNAQTFSFQTGVFTRTIAGRLARRTLHYQGVIKDQGATLDGTFSETITDYTAKPVVGKGDFLITRAARNGDTTLQNDAPLAYNDNYTLYRGGGNHTLTLDVLANDSDPENDRLTLTAVSAPVHGTASIVNGQIVYTPAADFLGVDSFTYTVTDGALSKEATVTVTVTDAPPPQTNFIFLPVVAR